MVHFDNIFVFQSLLRDEAVLKIPFFFFQEWLPVSALTVPCPVDKFPNKLAPKVPNNILKSPPFYSFVSFLIILVTPFSKKFESSSAWTILIISFISSFEINKVVVLDPNIFLCIPAAAAAAAVNRNGIKHF